MPLPTPEQIRGLVTAYASLRAHFARDLGQRPLVLPTSDFFPDAFDKSTQGAARLVRRMQAHAGMLDIPVQTRLLEDGASDTSCSSGACGTGPKLTSLAASDQLARVAEVGEGWELRLQEAELHHPVGLTTVVAESLARIFFVETARPGFRLPAPEPVSMELVGTQLGFGALLLEGAYVYAKSCGGPRVTQLTSLGTAELALGVALFAAREPRLLSKAERVLSTTQAAALTEARHWLNGNRRLALEVQAAPELIAAGGFQLAEPRPGFWSWFEGRRTSRELAELEGPNGEALGLPALSARPQSSTAAQRTRVPADDELKRLVEEELSAPRAEASSH